MRRFLTIIIGIILAAGLSTGCSKKDLEAFQRNDPYPPYNLLKLFDGFPSLKDGVDSLSTQKINYGLGRMLDLGIDMPEFLALAIELIEAGVAPGDPFLTDLLGELAELLGVLRDDEPYHYDDPSDEDGGFYDGSSLTLAQRQRGFYEALDTVMNNTDMGGDVLAMAAQVVNYLATEKTPAEIEETIGEMMAVRVYQECMYDDVTGYAVDLQAGSYTTDQLAALSIADNDISSLEVPIGMKITLYSDDNFLGDSLELSGNDRCLTDNPLGAGDWDDQASSIRVEYDVKKLAKLLGKVTMTCDYPMWVDGSHVPPANRDDANSSSYTTNTDLGNAVKGVVGLLYGLNSISAAEPEVRNTLNAIIQTDLPALMGALDSATIETLIQGLADRFATDEITPGGNTYDTDASYNNPSNPYVNAALKETIRDVFPAAVKLFIRDDGTGDADYSIFENNSGHSPVEALAPALARLRDIGIDYSQPEYALEQTLKQMVEYNAYGQLRGGGNFNVSALDHLIYTIGAAYHFGYLARNSSSGEPTWEGNPANNFPAPGSGAWGHERATNGCITVNDSMYNLTAKPMIEIDEWLFGVWHVQFSFGDSYSLALAHRNDQGPRIGRSSGSFTNGELASKGFYMGYDYPTLLLLPSQCAGDAGIPNGGERAITPSSPGTTVSVPGSVSQNDYRTYFPKVADGKGILNTAHFMMAWIARACWDGQGPYYATAGGTTTTWDFPGHPGVMAEVYYKPNGEVYCFVYKEDPGDASTWHYHYPSGTTQLSQVGVTSNDAEDPDDSGTPKQRINRYSDIVRSDDYLIENGHAGNFLAPPMNPENPSGVVAGSGDNYSGKYNLVPDSHNSSYFQIYERVHEISASTPRECDTQEEAIYRNFQWLMLEKKFMFIIPMNIFVNLGLEILHLNSGTYVIIEGNGLLGLANAKKGANNSRWALRGESDWSQTNGIVTNNYDYGDSSYLGDGRIIVFARQNNTNLVNADVLFHDILGDGYVLPDIVGKNIHPAVNMAFPLQDNTGNFQSCIPSNSSDIGDTNSTVWQNRSRLFPVLLALIGTMMDGTYYDVAGSGNNYNYDGNHKYPLAELLEGLMIPLGKPMLRYWTDSEAFGGNASTGRWVPRIEDESRGNYSYFNPVVKNSGDATDYRPRNIRTMLSLLAGSTDSSSDGLLAVMADNSQMVSRIIALLQTLGADGYDSEREEVFKGLEQLMTAMKIDKSEVIGTAGRSSIDNSRYEWIFSKRKEDLDMEEVLGYEGPYRAGDDWSDFRDFLDLAKTFIGGSRDITPNLVNIMNAVLAQPLTEDQVHGLIYTAGKIFARHKQDYAHPYPAPDVDEAWNYHGDTENNDALISILSTLPKVHDILADGSGGNYGLMMANMDQLLSDHDSLLYYVMENMTTSYGSDQILEDLQDFLQWHIVSDPNSPLWRDLALMLDGMAGMVGNPWDINVLFDYYGFQRN